MRLIDADYINKELSERDITYDNMICSMSMTHGRLKELIKAYISTVPTVKQNNISSYCSNCGAKMESGEK